MIVLLHSTKYNRHAHLIREGFRKLLDNFRVIENGGALELSEDVTTVILSSLNPLIYDHYRAMQVPKKINTVAIDSLDAYRPKPDYGEFDLVFLREYEKEYEAENVVPLSMGLTRGRAERISQYAKDWGDREIDVFFRSDVLVPGRRSIVRFFTDKRILQDYGLKEYNIDVAQGELPETEYYKRMGNAKCCLSPEGGGWDCFRHYEILATGAYPVLPFHWHWNPRGYHTPFGALRDAQEALNLGPDWSKIGIRLENEVDKSLTVLKEIGTRFNESIPYKVQPEPSLQNR